jgi:hypothetical protein
MKYALISDVHSNLPALEAVREAEDKGVRCFYALVMGENKRMLELLRHLDLPEQERKDEEHSVKRVEIELPSERHEAE